MEVALKEVVLEAPVGPDAAPAPSHHNLLATPGYKLSPACTYCYEPDTSQRQKTN